MAVTAKKWSLAQAEEIARDLISHLEAACERVELAGSVRRGRPVVGDLDLVCIPERIQLAFDLFGNTREVSALDEALRRLGVKWKGADKIHRFQWREMDVDLYIADQDTFALTWLIRSGSAEHNQFLSQLANQKGLTISYAEGLKDRRSGQVRIIKTERELFEALGLSFVEPHLREAVPVQGYPSFEPICLRKG